jgi:hypothetical protein
VGNGDLNADIFTIRFYAPLRGIARDLWAQFVLAGVAAMKRYFFDLGTRWRAMYDYEGREFAALDAAYQLAELIALDLEVDGDWSGWSVAVRSAEGKRIFLLPVPEADLDDG